MTDSQTDVTVTTTDGDAESPPADTGDTVVVVTDDGGNNGGAPTEAVIEHEGRLTRIEDALTALAGRVEEALARSAVAEVTAEIAAETAQDAVTEVAEAEAEATEEEEELPNTRHPFFRSFAEWRHGS